MTKIKCDKRDAVLLKRFARKLAELRAEGCEPVMGATFVVAVEAEKKTIHSHDGSHIWWEATGGHPDRFMTLVASRYDLYHWIERVAHQRAAKDDAARADYVKKVPPEHREEFEKDMRERTFLSEENMVNLKEVRS